VDQARDRDHRPDRLRRYHDSHRGRGAPAIVPSAAVTGPALCVAVPWLATADTNVAGAGNMCVRVTPVAVLVPWFATAKV
jgi:hypothetical protein